MEKAQIKYININDDYIVIEKPLNRELSGEENEALNKLVNEEYSLYIYDNNRNMAGIIYEVEAHIEGLVLLSRNKNFHEKMLDLIEKNLFNFNYLGIVSQKENNKKFKTKDSIELYLGEKTEKIQMCYEIINNHHIYNILLI